MRVDINNTKQMPLVSIIVATYRRDQELVRALESLSRLNYTNFEIILVDDNDEKVWNSKVEQIVRDFMTLNKDISIKYSANHPNQGSAKTRNIGIDIAEGEYICFLDDDDLYLADRINNQLYPMIEVNADFSITDLALYNEKEKLVEVRKRDYIKETTPEKLFQYHLMYHMTGTDTLMFKREYLKKIGGFDPIDMGDEFYLMMKAIETQGRFLYVPVCDVKAYIHTGNIGISSGQGKIDGENDLYKYKQKYFLKLSKKSVKYIKMRHYAVLTYAFLKKKDILKAIQNITKAIWASPADCIYLIMEFIGK